MDDEKVLSLSKYDRDLPEPVAINPHKTDIVFNALFFFTRKNSYYTSIFYFLISYCMIYLIGALTGQIHGRNGLAPMYTYIVDNLSMGLMAPIGAGLIANLYNKIIRTVENVYKKRILRPEDYLDFEKLVKEAEARYNNYFVMLAGTAVAIVISLCTYFFRDSWLGIRGGITGIYESLIIFVNFAMIASVVYKCAITIWFLQKILMFDLKIRPMHPDKSGGLRDVGSLAMAVNYFMIMVVLFCTIMLLCDNFGKKFFIIYLLFYVFTFFAFFGSLFRAHLKMKKAKEEVQAKLEATSNFYYNKLYHGAKGGIFELDSADEIVKVDKLYTIVEKMPVWPLDINNIIKFISAFVTPLVIFVGSILQQSDSFISFFHKLTNFFTK